ncbi:hypothetical protein HN51_049023 [Arachis hypogaea]|nr:uncharacterized protein LOC112728630 [Arachis hypogaea]QHO25715.1 putative disease resistance protein [Arachis hypogaea]
MVIQLKVLLMKDTFTSSNILEVLESLKQLQILRLGYGGEAILIDKLEELCINLKTMRGIRKFWLSFIDEPIEMATLLELITLQYLYNIKEVPSITYTCHLEALREVEINGCDSITHFTWLKHAQCLEILQVRNCNSIQELVKEDQGETVDMDLFPHLRFLKLSFLVRLKRIYNEVLPFHHGCWMRSSAENRMVGQSSVG